MISVSNKVWNEKNINKNLILKLSEKENFTDTLSKILLSRKFNDEEIYSINNELPLKNVFKNNVDFKKALDLLLYTIKNNEKICILGDYDVDGSVSTSLLVKFFTSINHPHFFYIPDRETDGYGPSINLFNKLIKKKPKLMIMVDCGSNSFDAIKYLNKNKIKSLIIDHHQISKPFPLADSIINPKKDNGYIEYDYLCATSLTYFFLDLFIITIKKKISNISNLKLNIEDDLIYVLLATVCDVMPLRKLNRTIAINAIKKFKLVNNKVFKAIFGIFKKNNKITIDDLGFLIGPILNSGGRLSKSNYATNLLSTNNDKEIFSLVSKLINLNEKRKIIENRILSEINFLEIEKLNDDIIILYNPNYNEGLIGIIAARIKDYFNKPSIIITNSQNILKGSCRSIPNFDMGSFIRNALERKILITGGGHRMAAGFTLKKNNLKTFKKFINKSFFNLNIENDNLFNYDLKVSSSAFNKSFYDEISKLKPFGTDNNDPLFLFENLKIIKSKIIKKKHISNFFKSKSGYSIKSISFNAANTKVGEYLLNYKNEINVIGQIKENFWNNKYTLQLVVKDLII